jgi:hypothetical protein
VTPDSKNYCKKPTSAGLAQEIGFPAPNSSTLPWLVNGAHSCASPKKNVINWT